MNLTFEKATLLARMAEEFNRNKKDMFTRTTKMIAGGNYNGFNRASPEKLKGRLEEYRRDIEQSEALIAELRGEIIDLAEGTQVRTLETRPANGSSAQ